MRSIAVRRLVAGLTAAAVAATATVVLVVVPTADEAGNSLKRVVVGNSLGNSL